jgi:hypothetical protein
MKQETELINLFETWRTLTADEGNAILAGDWVTVTECQYKKRLLQDQLAFTESRLREQDGEDATAPLEPRLRGLLDELISLEKQNLSSVQIRHRTAETEQTELNQSSRNLRQIHRAYSCAQSARWHSYS